MRWKEISEEHVEFQCHETRIQELEAEKRKIEKQSGM